MEQKQTPPKDQNEILTQAECAALLQVKRETLWRYRRDEGLPFVEMTKKGVLADGKKHRRPRIRYMRSAVMAWLQDRTGNGPAAPRPRGRPRTVDRAKRRDDGRSA